MLACLARIAFLTALVAAPVNAAEIDDFNVAIEQVASHNRVAIGYLRTGNVDLASLEIDRLRDAWAEAVSRFGRPFGPFAENKQLYTTTMLDVSVRIVTAQIMSGSGRPDNARDALAAIRNELSDLRKKAGVPVLADCIRDSNDAMDKLFAFNDSDLDWSKSTDEVSASARAYGATLERCDAMADTATQQSPE
ncbi:MAG: hypothetical protein JO237_12375, partial [Pseudolabrys sp.]|nr:hypothetical protein [Pseudolabrys sp.]